MKKTSLGRYLACAAVAALLPLRAAAQSGGEGVERIDTVRRDARTQLGPIYLTPRIVLKELGVDSNVFNSAGEQEADFTATINPKLDMWLPVARRALFQATTSPELVWYATHGSERSVDPHFAGRTEIYLRRSTLFAAATYANTRQRLNHEIDVRARHVEQTLSTGVAVSLTAKSSIETTVRVDQRRFDANAEFDGVFLQPVLSQTTTGLRVIGKHRLTPLTTLVARVERLEDEFPFLPARNSSSVRVMPGVEFKPLALVSGHAYVGHRRFDPSVAGTLPEFSGLVAALGLSYTLLESTTFGVSYLRDLTYSYEEQRPFFIDDSVGASVRRAIGPRFDVLMSADRHRYGYRNILATDGGAPELQLRQRTDVTWNYAASLGYRMGEGRVGFGLAYSTRHSSANSLRDYDNLRFAMTMTYGF